MNIYIYLSSFYDTLFLINWNTYLKIKYMAEPNKWNKTNTFRKCQATYQRESWYDKNVKAWVHISMIINNF